MTDSDKARFMGIDIGSGVKPKSSSASEMLVCEACLRANPPTRANCIYCGAKLAAVATGEEGSASVESNQQPATAGEGYCLVLPADQIKLITEASMTSIASLCRLKIDELQSAVNGGGPVPLSHASTADQVTRFANDLRAMGIEAVTITDEELKVNIANRKVRALEFSDELLTAFGVSSGETLSATWDDLSLIVPGRLVVNRREVEERRKRGRPMPHDSRELFSDESVLDLYTRSNVTGWRISAATFDFSCLGSKKALTAFENLFALIELLRGRSANVEVNQSYQRMRPVLASVWPVEANTVKGGWKRSCAGKVDVSTVTTTDNEAQFNNYSRLLHYLKLRELESGR